MTQEGTLTPTLDLIAAKGNRGHNLVDNNWITCRDGTEISVIAGGGTYSVPRPTYCHTIDGTHYALASVGPYVACDYPGPYTEVEVWLDGDDEPQTMPVDAVREYILSHGGEA